MKQKKERVDRLVKNLLEDDTMRKKFCKLKSTTNKNEKPKSLCLDKTIESMNPMIKNIELMFLPRQLPEKPEVDFLEAGGHNPGVFV